MLKPMPTAPAVVVGLRFAKGPGRLTAHRPEHVVGNQQLSVL